LAWRRAHRRPLRTDTRVPGATCRVEARRVGCRDATSACRIERSATDRRRGRHAGVDRGALRPRTACRTARVRPLTRIVCRIQTHPARAALIPPLLERLHGFDDLAAIADPEPGASVANAWRSYRACLEAIPPGAHGLIVQDDSIPCRNLAAALDRIVAAHPDRIICLFVGGAPKRSADNVTAAGGRGDPYAELHTGDWLPCVATVYPPAHVAGILEFVDRRDWPHNNLGDDHRLGEYIRAAGITALATVPNLVQHPDEVRSLIGTHALAGLNPARVSCCYIGNHDPLQIDWS